MSDESSNPGRESRIAAVEYDYGGREKEHVRECNLCRAQNHVEVSRHDRYGFAVHLRICAGCGLGFLSPRMTEREYAHFYAFAYRPLVSAYHGRKLDPEALQASQSKYAAELIDFLEPLLDGAPESVMDVGGSTGAVAAAIGRRFGSAATVLDPAPQELAVAEHAGMEAIEGTAEAYDAGGRTWELVMLCQTIDHLLDVKASLASLREMIAPGGHAFIDVVDLEFGIRLRNSIDGVAKIDHPFYLTRATALAYFALLGLDVMAERVSKEGLIGFLVRRGEPREPDWDRLRAGADRLIDEICRGWATAP